MALLRACWALISRSSSNCRWSARERKSCFSTYPSALASFLTSSEEQTIQEINTVLRFFLNFQQSKCWKLLQAKQHPPLILLSVLYWSQSKAVLFRTVILGRFVSLLTRELSFETGRARFSPVWAAAVEVPLPEGSSSTVGGRESTTGADSRRLFLGNGSSGNFVETGMLIYRSKNCCNMF